LTNRLPEFAGSEWEEVSINFYLNPTVKKYQILSFSVPYAYLRLDSTSGHERFDVLTFDKSEELKGGPPVHVS